VRAVGGLLLALPVAAGIGGRHLLQHREAGTAVIRSAETGVAPAPSAPAGAETVLTVYAVGSEDQATSIQVSMEELNDIRRQLGASLLRYTIVVVGPDDAPVLRALHDDSRLGTMQVIDLRAGS
jgi:hypothetical protein